jgi:hypothetical protein
MIAHDILEAGSGLRPNSRGQALASFNGCTVGVSRFSAHPLWERHPAGDELLQVSEGELDITVLTPEGPVESNCGQAPSLSFPRDSGTRPGHAGWSRCSTSGRRRARKSRTTGIRENHADHRDRRGCGGVSVRHLTDRARLVEFAAMSRMPAIYGLREFVDAGGLISYGTDHRILTAARPADLPVEPPTRFELAVNLKTAQALGLTIPPSVLLRADYVIQ